LRNGVQELGKAEKYLTSGDALSAKAHFHIFSKDIRAKTSLFWRDRLGAVSPPLSNVVGKLNSLLRRIDALSSVMDQSNLNLYCK
jgi:hypothetical protein